MYEPGETVLLKPKTIHKKARLLIIDKLKTPKLFELGEYATIGREYQNSNCTIRVNSAIVGRRHGEFIYNVADNSYYYIDNNSMNGTYINGSRLQKYNDRGTKAYKLTEGDIIRIDRSDLSNPHSESVLMIFSNSFDNKDIWKFCPTPYGKTLTIGREKGCTLKLADFMASRIHAFLICDGSSWRIKDNNSMNGVSVNGVEIESESVVRDHDVVQIANTLLVFFGGGFFYNTVQESKASLIIDIKEKSVNRGRKILLRDIHAELSNGDFVLILGGSGAGKTTLIKAVLGENKAEGKIILNGQDLYKNFKNMKSQIGMVPQFLTLRTNDTVRNTLNDTAAIKMGRKYTKEEKHQRVEDVLQHVGITEHADKYIGDLSGGQQKKVAVANQLIGFQKVFICDEPDSGLDAASRMQQMDILKEITREGKIVMVISHEPDDAIEIVNGSRKHLFTKVLVLARSSQDKAGHLAYFGDIESAFNFFGVNRLQDIMLEINPPAEGGKGRGDFFIQKFKSGLGG